MHRLVHPSPLVGDGDVGDGDRFWSPVCWLDEGCLLYLIGEMRGCRGWGVWRLRRPPERWKDWELRDGIGVGIGTLQLDWLGAQEVYGSLSLLVSAPHNHCTPRIFIHILLFAFTTTTTYTSQHTPHTVSPISSPFLSPNLIGHSS